MRPIWIASFLAGSVETEPAFAADAELPAIATGAFADWARTAYRRDDVAPTVGAACVTADGREGRLVTVDAPDGTPGLACLPA